MGQDQNAKQTFTAAVAAGVPPPKHVSLAGQGETPSSWDKGMPSAADWDELQAILARERAERAKLEVQLREIEFRFRSLTEFAHDGVISTDRAGLIQSFNEPAGKFFGRAPAEMTGKRFTDLLLPAEGEHYWEEVTQYMSTGASSVAGKWVELAGTTQEGKEFPIEIFLQPGASAEQQFLTFIIHNLSRRRLVEETLRRETARVEFMQKVAAAANEAGSIEEALQAAVDLICSYGDWAVGHVYLLDANGWLAPTNIWHLKSREWFEEFRENTIRHGPAGAGYLATRVMVDKEPLWINDFAQQELPRSKAAEEVGLASAFAFPVTVQDELRAVCEFFSSQQREPDASLLALANYISGQIGRVIERKWAEAALQDSDAKYRDLFDEAPVGYHELDATGMIRRVNQTELTMLGYSAEEMIGKPVWEFLVEPGSRSQIEARVAGTAPAGPLERVYRCQDGRHLQVLVHERLIRDPQQNSVGILGTIQDISARKRAEAALRTSEERNRTLLANLPQQVFFKNSELKFEIVNDFFAASLSKRPEEIIGKTDYDFYPPALADKYRQDDLRVMRSRRLEVLVEKNSGDGQERWVEVIKSPVIDSHGDVLGVLGLFTDITERKKAEEFRTRLAAIVESSRDAIISETPEGAIASWNLGAEVIYGYSAEEVIGRSIDILSPNELVEAGTRFQARVREGGGRVQNVDTIHLRKNGERIHVSLTISPIFGGDGEMAGASLVARDVTALKQAEVEMERARALLQSVIETLPVIVFMKSAEDGRFIMLNRAGKELLGLTDAQILGKTDSELFEPAQAEQFRKSDRETIDSGKLVELEETIETTRRGPRLLQTRKIPILDRSGNAQYVLGISEDITERKSADQKLKLYALRLEQSNRALQDFASVASHDLQEPLRKVQAFGDRLKTKFSRQLTDEGADYLQRMQNAAQRMQKLIEDLLAFSRITSKAQPFVPVDLNEIVRDVLSDLEIRIEQKKAAVEVGSLPVIDADPTQMRQLLQNLTVNALKFQPAGATPRVKIYSSPAALKPEAGRENGAVVEAYEIVVEDNGIGFDEKYGDKIFTVFQRLHSRQEYEGTGVGLAICQKIVERHQGNIRAASQPGKGAKFLVTLPARQMESRKV